MASISTWYRYLSTKMEYARSLTLMAYDRGQIRDNQLLHNFLSNFCNGKLTFLHWIRGAEMFPKIPAEGVTLLVRYIPEADPKSVHLRDLIVLKDPANPKNYLVRRVAAVEGYEMASTDEQDEPFVLEKDDCWVLSDNNDLKPKEAYDSRTFGPVTVTDIVGRVIYFLRNNADHGPVNNSGFSKEQDSPVLQIELDVNEMAKNHKP